MITNTSCSVTYTAAAAAPLGPYAIGFPFADAADIRVRRLRGGEWTALEGFEVSPEGGGDGGAVTLAEGSAQAGDVLAISRAVPATQELALEPNGILPSASLERALDRVVMCLQQVMEALSRAPVLPEVVDGVDGADAAAAAAAALPGLAEKGIPQITAGTTTTLQPGQPATASITGTAPNFVASFGIPKGAPGKDGAPGEAPTFNVGMTVLEEGATPTVSVSRAMVEGAWVYTLTFGLPATGSIETDAAPTQSSTNAVQSGGVYTALAAKADASALAAKADASALAAKLDAPSAAGSAGQVPAKTASGMGWSTVDALTPAARDYTVSTAAALTLSPGHSPVKATVAANGTLALSNGASSSTGVGYLELVVDLGEGATVTAGAGLTLVDALAPGAVNHCIVRWDNGAAELFVWRAE